MLCYNIKIFSIYIERVKPEIDNVVSKTNETTVQWIFQINVCKRIKKFRVICRDMYGKSEVMFDNDEQPLRNIVTFLNTNLQPKHCYFVKVQAIYEDDFISESEEHSFRSHGKFYW